jgi:hypothetical protein
MVVSFFVWADMRVKYMFLCCFVTSLLEGGSIVTSAACTQYSKSCSIQHILHYELLCTAWVSKRKAMKPGYKEVQYALLGGCLLTWRAQQTDAPTLQSHPAA